MATSAVEQHLFEVELYGFTVIEGVLDPDAVARLRATNERLLESAGSDLDFHGRAGHVANLPALDAVYHPCIDHPRVLPVLEAAMGRDLILASLNSRVVRPGESEQGLHSDVPGQLRRPGAPIMMNTIWMLDDFTLENGATRLVPGSHRNDSDGPPPGRSVDLVHRAVAAAGSVLAFYGQCWHGGGANLSGRPRHALFGHYRVASWMRFQCDPHRGFDPAWLSRLSERQKRLMRMHKGLGHPHSCDWDEV